MLKDIFRGFGYWAFSSLWIVSAIVSGFHIPSLSGFSVIPTFIIMVGCIILGLMELNVIGEALRKEAEKNELSEM